MTDDKPPWDNNTYPWRVGHRLKKSQKTLPHKKARAYFRELRKKGCKTRFIYQVIPLSELLVWTFETREADLIKSINSKNPITAALRKHNPHGHIEGGAIITKEIKYK